MTKQGCFSLAASEVQKLIRRKQFDLLKSVVFAGAMILFASGCANIAKGAKVGSRSEQHLSKEEVLERKLRRAQAKIETLRERNLILKSRIKMISRSGTAEPLAAKEDMNGFDNGVVLDVPIDTRREPQRAPSRAAISAREEVLNKIDLRPSARSDKRAELRMAERPRSLTSKARRLPAKAATVVTSARTNSARTNSSVATAGEQADRALVRTIVALLKEKDFAEAERTATLLEKSYPDSSALAEAKFQIGLAYYRARAKMAGAMQKADGFFAESLGHKAGHVRVKAGASLMRGVIAKQMGTPGGDLRNIEIAKQNFKYVISAFPKTIEARRARAELSAINRRVK